MDIEEQYNKIYRYCYMKPRNHHTSEDLTQETFLRFLENHSYREIGKQMAYLYVIARNLCNDYYRSGKRNEIPTENQQEQEDISAGFSFEKVEILDALGRLDQEEREMILLRYINEECTVIANLYLSNLLLLAVGVSGAVYIILNLFCIQYKRERLFINGLVGAMSVMCIGIWFGKHLDLESTISIGAVVTAMDIMSFTRMVFPFLCTVLAYLLLYYQGI